MPRLLVFAACESVLIDGDDNSASLISLLEGVTVGIEGELPEDARLPWKWIVFSLWRKEEGDEGKAFEQNVQLVSPSGKPGVENIAPFVMQKTSHRIKLGYRELPIGEFGVWSVNLSFREVGVGEWKQVTSYPIGVIRSEEKTNEQPKTEATEVG
jgi:hypothetical protein